MNSQLSNTNFTKESLKKQFRLSEFLAEKIISSVAFLSIAIIFLIFIFVFKESLPIFSTGKEAAKTEIQATNSASKPESYGSTPTEELKPESYGTEPTEELKPETYGSEPVSQADLQPETYGDVKAEPLTSDSEEMSDKVAETENGDGAGNTWNTFLTTEWVPVSDNPRFGLFGLLIGTLKVTIIAMLIASKKTKEIIKPIIEMLAAFPSVVIGFFALMVLASFFQNVFGYDSRLNAFVGGVAMALAAIPIIYTISEDALSSIPKTYTEASLALGASKWQTAFFVVLPAATPGIFAALLLGVGRVFGETMIALMATGNAALVSSNPFESVRTFAATIGAEMAETVFGETHYSVLFFIGSLLFIFSFGLNALAEFYVKGKLIKKFQGK
jgi:phosphate transport system permease protein